MLILDRIGFKWIILLKNCEILLKLYIWIGKIGFKLNDWKNFETIY